MSSRVMPQSGVSVPRSRFSRCVRWLGPLVAGGMLLQTDTGGCSQSLDSILNTLAQSAVQGLGTGVSNLAQVLVLNLFI
jgi:hypothetical protein